MAKNGYDQTYEDDRKENEETADLLPRAGRAIAGAAGKAKDYVVNAVENMPQVKTMKAMKDRYDAAQMPVEKKAKGGKVKLFKHHDGIAQRGKTRAQCV